MSIYCFLFATFNQKAATTDREPKHTITTYTSFTVLAKVVTLFHISGRLNHNVQFIFGILHTIVVRKRQENNAQEKFLNVWRTL